MRKTIENPTYWEVNPFTQTELWHKLREERLSYINNLLTTYKGLHLKLNDRRFIIISPSAKKQGYTQASFFLDGIPTMDIARETITELAEELIGYNFEVLETIA